MSNLRANQVPWSLRHPAGGLVAWISSFLALLSAFRQDPDRAAAAATLDRATVETSPDLRRRSFFGSILHSGR